MDWTIEFYCDENGVCQVQDFLKHIGDKKLKAKILHDIELLQKYGTKLTLPHVKYIGDEIWELRTKQSSNIARTLYFIFTGREIVLLNGFVKKKDRTPPEEKSRAIRFKENYKRRKGQ